MGAVFACFASPHERRSSDELANVAHDVYDELRTVALRLGRVAGSQVALGADLDVCSAYAFRQFEAVVDAARVDRSPLDLGLDSWKPVIRMVAQCTAEIALENGGDTSFDDESLLERIAPTIRAHRAKALLRDVSTNDSFVDATAPLLAAGV